MRLLAMAIANSGQDIINTINTTEQHSIALPLHQEYEIQRTVQAIITGNYSIVPPLTPSILLLTPQIALQFPDQLLHHAVPVYHQLRKLLPPHKELYILADTTYASHVNPPHPPSLTITAVASIKLQLSTYRLTW